jgi:putative CocE/NonD family hydrolase
MMPRPVKPRAPSPDTHFRPDAVLAVRSRPPRPAARTSRYLVMRDGVRVAIDLHLPGDLRPGERLPAIVRQTRYFRSVQVKPPFDRLPVSKMPDLYHDTRRLFLSHGYAWVDVDVRGTGASFGFQPYPWAENEVKDGGDVVSWIVAQPWSNGKVGSFGISYDGTTAEMLLVNNHPAVRAVAPMFSLFDVYADVAFPGGLHLEWFTGVWSRFNRTLDDNDYPSAMAQALWLMFQAGRSRDADSLLRFALPRLRAVSEPDFVRALSAALRQVFGSVRPTDGGAALLESAIADHRASFDIHQGALRIRSRDDAGLQENDPTATIDALSPHHYTGALRSSGAAVYSIGGFRDGAYQHSAIKRFRTVRNPGSKLLLGPFCHAGKLYCGAAHPARPSAFDMDAELLRFFDLHLRDADDGMGAEAPVRYYTTGEEAWKSAAEWPPSGAAGRSLHFGPERSLSWQAPSTSGTDDYRVDPTTGTGPRSRWRGLLGHLIAADYPDRRGRDQALLVYTAPALDRDTEVTGHPVVTLRLRCTAADAAVFAYLEEVMPDGEVRYLTEGQIRLLHRALSASPPYDSPAPYHSFLQADTAPVPAGQTVEVSFGLLPLSHRLRRGSRVRLAIAGADADHFAAPPVAGASLGIEWGPGGSRLDLPIFAG